GNWAITTFWRRIRSLSRSWPRDESSPVRFWPHDKTVISGATANRTRGEVTRHLQNWTDSTADPALSRAWEVGPRGAAGPVILHRHYRSPAPAPNSQYHTRRREP